MRTLCINHLMNYGRLFMQVSAFCPPAPGAFLFHIMCAQGPSNGQRKNVRQPAPGAFLSWPARPGRPGAPGAPGSAPAGTDMKFNSFLITAGPKFVAGGGLGLGPRRGAPEECARAHSGAGRFLGGNRGVPCGFVADSSLSTFLNKTFLNKNSAVSSILPG